MRGLALRPPRHPVQGNGGARPKRLEGAEVVRQLSHSITLPTNLAPPPAALGDSLTVAPMADLRQATLYMPWALLQRDDYAGAVEARKGYLSFNVGVHTLQRSRRIRPQARAPLWRCIARRSGRVGCLPGAREGHGRMSDGVWPPWRAHAHAHVHTHARRRMCRTCRVQQRQLARTRRAQSGCSRPSS